MGRPWRDDDQRRAKQRRWRMLAQKNRKSVAGCCLGLCGSRPLQQQATAYQHAPEGTYRRVQQHQRLHRQLAELPGSSANRAYQFAATDLKKVMPRNAAARRHQACQRPQEGSGEQRGQSRQQGCGEWQRPGEDHPDYQRERARHDKRTTQVVAHLPHTQRIDAVAPCMPHERQQLPVAAGPAMVACSSHARMVRMILY